MAALVTTPAAAGKRPGVRRAKRHDLRIDMTPMVDLGFLLISFFVITTELSQPRTTNLNMPKNGPAMPLGESDALTILLDRDNRIWYYEGEWSRAVAAKQVYPATFDIQDGIGRVIRAKQVYLDGNGKEGRKGLMLLIKPMDEASYAGVIDALDLALIWSIKKYAILKPDPEEVNYLRGQAGRE
ncbi:MAG: biopolymer transporter ExbD [Chitinophagaceae bacterium]